MVSDQEQSPQRGSGRTQGRSSCVKREFEMKKGRSIGTKNHRSPGRLCWHPSGNIEAGLQPLENSTENGCDIRQVAGITPGEESRRNSVIKTRRNH